MGHYFGPKTAKDLGGDSADSSSANDSHRFAVKIKPDQTGERKIQLPNAVKRAMDFAVQRQEQCHGVFSDGVRRICRHAHDRDAHRSCCDEVHIVITGASQSDQLYAKGSQSFEAQPISLIIDKDADALRSFRRRRRIPIEPEFVEVPAEALRARRLHEVFTVVGFGIVNSDFYHRVTGDLLAARFFEVIGDGFLDANEEVGKRSDRNDSGPGAPADGRRMEERVHRGGVSEEQLQRDRCE